MPPDPFLPQARDVATQHPVPEDRRGNPEVRRILFFSLPTSEATSHATKKARPSIAARLGGYWPCAQLGACQFGDTG
ncbi:MAG: hypothetical protein RIS70_508 [Planctomycetota bacterium]